MHITGKKPLPDPAPEQAQPSAPLPGGWKKLLHEEPGLRILMSNDDRVVVIYTDAGHRVSFVRDPESGYKNLNIQMRDKVHAGFMIQGRSNSREGYSLTPLIGSQMTLDFDGPTPCLHVHSLAPSDPLHKQF